MSKAPWFDRVTELLGLYEAPGDKDNPVILAMAKACGGKIAKTYSHDLIPWCALTVNYCLIDSGQPGDDSLWALDFRNYGKKLSKPVLGAIATKKRAGGGHVFFVAGKTRDGRIIGRGGNQDDMVCDAAFNASELQYNWPTGIPVDTSPLPIVASLAKTHRPVTLAMLGDNTTALGFADVPEDMPEHDPFPEPVLVPQAKAAPVIPETTIQGDPDIWNAQRRLKAIGYNPGGVDGVWGGLTAGAITGFINDRHLTFDPPTSREQFHTGLSKLVNALGEAESEHYTRPVSQERALATETTIIAQAPEIIPVRRNKLTALWGALVTGFFAMVNFIVDRFQDGLSYLTQFKEYLALIPAWGYLLAIFAVFMFFAFNSKSGVDKITDAFRKGDRS